MQEIQDYQCLSIEEILADIGNGYSVSGVGLLKKIVLRLRHARDKHPVFAQNVYHCLGVITAEHEELVYAVEYETSERQQDETLDVIATAIRFANEEYRLQD